MKPEKFGGDSKQYEVVIIGSCIAGSVLAFELEKREVDYFICTEQKSSLLNTSSLSYGHCRIPEKSKLEEIITKSVLNLGEDRKRMKFIYENSNLVINLFKELDINFEYRSFGIIPLNKKRGGRIILEDIQKNIKTINTETELIGFDKINNLFEINLKNKEKCIKIMSRYLVLATGGYSGSFKYTDNFRYKNYNTFEIVKQNGGEIINLNSIFIHPFGYNNGKSILIGNETKKGEFLDLNNNFVFNKEVRQLIKENNYHENFDVILKEIEYCKKNNSKIYFVSSEKKIEIIPTIHYTSGGIKTNYLGEVIGIKNLFAIGECKADGSKKGGRFPGYPFTSAIVNGKILADKLAIVLKTCKNNNEYGKKRV